MKQPILRYLALRLPEHTPDALLRIDEEFLQTLDATQRLVDAARASADKAPPLLTADGADDVTVSIPLVGGCVGLPGQAFPPGLVPLHTATDEIWWAHCVTRIQGAHPYLMVSSRGAFLGLSKGGSVSLVSADIRPFVAQAIMEHAGAGNDDRVAIVSPQEARNLIDALRARNKQEGLAEYLDDPGGQAAYREAKHNADVAVALVRHLLEPAAETADDEL